MTSPQRSSKRQGMIVKAILYGSHGARLIPPRAMFPISICWWSLATRIWPTALRTRAERIDLRLVDPWSRETHKDRALFEKLKDAYVKARCSKDYRIDAEELT